MQAASSSGSPQHKSIFAGLKVLASVRVLAGPFATYHFALHGADVLTIENPKEHDSMRTAAGDHGTEQGQALLKQGLGAGFISQNANKRAMTLNLASPQGQEIFRRLAKEADVVVENLIAGTMPRYGLGYEDLKKINPKLIYCSLTGFGQTGPYARKAAIDMAIQAASGMMHQTGTPETGPLKVGFTVVDYSTGYAAALAITSALYHRAMTGEGQHIDISMLETAMSLNSVNTTRAATTGALPKLAGNGSGHGGYVTDVFKCKEGYLSIATSTALRRQKMFNAIGRPDLPDDSRFKTPELARQNYPQLYDEIEKTLQAKTAIEWEEIILAGGAAAMAVRTMDQAVQHPQIQHRGYFHRFEKDPELGVMTVPKAPFQFSETPAEIHSPAPRFGQHTDEVLKDLGFSSADIAKLRADGVV
jgi:CoA:oxalate CoA-transferase